CGGGVCWAYLDGFGRSRSLPASVAAARSAATCARSTPEYLSAARGRRYANRDDPPAGHHGRRGRRCAWQSAWPKLGGDCDPGDRDRKRGCGARQDRVEPPLARSRQASCPSLHGHAGLASIGRASYACVSALAACGGCARPAQVINLAAGALDRGRGVEELYDLRRTALRLRQSEREVVVVIRLGQGVRPVELLRRML